MLGKVAIDDDRIATVRVRDFHYIVPLGTGNPNAVFPMVQASEGVDCLAGETGLFWFGFVRRLVAYRFVSWNLLAQDQHVRDDAGPRVFLVRVARHPVARNDLALFCQFLPNRRVLLVHRACGRKVHNEPARLGEIRRLQKIVVMDRGFVFVVPWVV